MVCMNLCREFFLDGLDGFSPGKCLDEFLWKKFGMVWMNSAGKFVDEFLWRSSFGKFFG